MIMKNLLIFFGLINIAVFSLLGILSNPPSPNTQANRLTKYYKEYSISPTYNNGFIPSVKIIYPKVRTRPGGTTYFFSLLKEDRDLIVEKYDPAFFANKRVA